MLNEEMQVEISFLNKEDFKKLLAKQPNSIITPAGYTLLMKFIVK